MSFEQQIADRIRTLTVWCVVLSVAFIVALAVAIWGQLRVTTDEHATCQIQSRGLRSTPYLVGSLDDLHQILTLPPTAQSKHNESLMPKAELAHELALLKALDGNLAMYVSISDRQPRHRAC